MSFVPRLPHLTVSWARCGPERCGEDEMCGGERLERWRRCGRKGRGCCGAVMSQ